MQSKIEKKLNCHLLYQLAEKVSEALRNVRIRKDFLGQQKQQKSLVAVHFTELRFLTKHILKLISNFRRFKLIRYWTRQSELPSWETLLNQSAGFI